jgi:hypothetical protein
MPVGDRVVEKAVLAVNAVIDGLERGALMQLDLGTYQTVLYGVPYEALGGRSEASRTGRIVVNVSIPCNGPHRKCSVHEPMQRHRRPGWPEARVDQGICIGPPEGDGEVRFPKTCELVRQSAMSTHFHSRCAVIPAP